MLTIEIEQEDDGRWIAEVDGTGWYARLRRNPDRGALTCGSVGMPHHR